MNNLVHAGFARLFKSLCFKIYLAFAVAYSVFNVVTRYVEINRYLDAGGSPDDFSMSMDSLAFDSAMTLMLASAFFVAMFIGREYTDGALRNKLIVGRGRGSIYLSNLVVCVCANLMAAATALIVTFALGIPILGLEMGALECLSNILCELLALTAVTAIYLIIAMMISSRAIEMLISVIAALGMLFFTTYIDSALKEPEFYGGFSAVSVDENGNATMEYIDKQKNPFYLEGEKRKVFEFIDSFMPSSQLYNVCNGHSEKTPKLPQTAIYDIIIVLAAAEGGVLLFSKKDIK